MDKTGIKINIYIEEGLDILSEQEEYESNTQFDEFQNWETKATIVRQTNQIEYGLDALIMMIPEKINDKQRKKIGNMIEKYVGTKKYFVGKPQIYVLAQHTLDKTLHHMFSNQYDQIKFQPYNLIDNYKEIVEYCLSVSYASKVQGVVAEKLMSDERKKGHSKEILYSTARHLAFPSVLHATYFGSSKNYFDEQPTRKHKEDDLTKSMLFPQEQRQLSLNSTTMSDTKMDYSHDEYEFHISEDWKNEICQQMVNRTTNQMKIKFLVVKLDEDEPGFFEHMSSNVTKWALSFVGMYPDLGMLHTALVVGPHKIEWNNSSYCMPRQAISRRPVFCLDLATIPNNKEYEKLTKIVSKHVVEWNIYKKYTRMHANCQHFVVDLIEKLGLNTQFDRCLSIMKSCLDDIQRPSHTMKPSRAFCDVFGLDPKTPFQFSTHEELDELVRKLQQKDMYLLNRPYIEVEILKAYDRPYWIKYSGISEDYDKMLQTYKNNLPEDDQNVKKVKQALERCRPHHFGCPFTEPSLTGSILPMPTPDWSKGRSTHQ